MGIKEFYEIISGDLKHFTFENPKELCERVAGYRSYKVVENYYDSHENATKITLDVPSLHKEVSVYIQKTTRNCAEDFCF